MQDLQSILNFHNPWWLTGRVPTQLDLPFRRPVFDTVFDYLNLGKVIILKGPRRTGKSTILFQLMQELLQTGVESRRLLYLPLDDPDIRHDFNDIILEFEKQLGREISQGPKVYCFLDEIQYFENWPAYLKKYADKKWPVRFIVSGSSASLIKQGAESLAGRTVEEVILPFSFFEFLLYHLEKEEASLLKEFHLSFDLSRAVLPPKVNTLERKIAILFNSYLSMGGFPELFSVKEPVLRKKLLREDIIEKIIYRDLVTRYAIKKPETLERLFLYLVNHSSDILNVASVANSLKLSREVTQSYVQYLREAYLLILTPRFAPAIETVVRSNPKVYVTDAALLEVFADLPIGKRVESMVAKHLYSKTPSYYRNKWEVDFVLRLNRDFLPIEVKYRENIRNQDLAGLRGMQSKIDFDRALVVTKGFTETQGPFTFLPAHLFLALV